MSSHGVGLACDLVLSLNPLQFLQSKLVGLIQHLPRDCHPSRNKGDDSLPASAILLVSPGSLFDLASTSLSSRDQSATPVCCVKVLGKSVLERTISQLQAVGVSPISVMHEAMFNERLMFDELSRQVGKSLTSLFLIKLSAYAEVNYAELLKFHHEAKATTIRVCDTEGPLDFWVTDPVRLLRGGISFDSSLMIDDDPHLRYRTNGYVNRMTDARAIRRFAVDMLRGRCATQPCGEQVRPGMWVDCGARVHGSARIIAPAYVGRGARIRASALINATSTVEQYSVVDRDAIVEESSILPQTYVGKGINVAHAIVGGSRLVHLRSDLAVTIDDPRIIGRAESIWRPFFYDNDTVDFVRPVVKPAAPEPIKYASGRQRTALGVFSKGA